MMTLYHVHLYREMRLTFEGIEAETAQAAAAIAHDKPTDEAVAIEDCDGENLAAEITPAGDEMPDQPVTIDFAAERLRQSIPDLLALSHRVVQARLAGETVSDQLHVASVLLIATLEDDPLGADDRRVRG
ncbi:hypothetical protein ACYOEI_10990 [Singulisphaera rosea]